MTWAIAWSSIAERELMDLPWHVAERVDASVIALAGGRASRAIVERMSPTDPYRLRLRLREASALVWLEPAERVVHVARVLRNR